MSYSNKKWYKPSTLNTKIIFMIIIVFFIRLLSNIPVPFINKDYLTSIYADSDIYSLLNTFSGGAFSQMTIMALGVTPYITASIVLQLLCVTFPRLSEIQKDQSITTQKRWKLITVITGLVLGLIQSIGMSINLGKKGLFTTYSFSVILIICTLWTIGAIITILAGEYITKYCIGNGISIILAANIISQLPGDIVAFYQMYIANKSIPNIILAILTLLVIIFGLVSFTVVLTNAQKEIPVIYPNKNTMKINQKNKSVLPIKLNGAGVMPIIFTSTLFSLPFMFISNTNKITNIIYKVFSTRNWYDISNVLGFIGLLIYFVLVIAFAYFYNSITFIPAEIAARLRKKGATIPGIRPGNPTEKYIAKKSKYIIAIGAIMLFVLSQIPTIITNASNIYSLSFGSTSVIIVIGVIVETTATIKAELLVKNYVKHTTTKIFGVDATRI